MRGAIVEGEEVMRNPIRGIFAGCCASAMTATASGTTTNRIDKTAAFLIAHTISLCITRAVVEKSEIYEGRRQVFVEWEDQIQPEIELIDASL
jgi:hypothetical protein